MKGFHIQRTFFIFQTTPAYLTLHHPFYIWGWICPEILWKEDCSMWISACILPCMEKSFYQRPLESNNCMVTRAGEKNGIAYVIAGNPNMRLFILQETGLRAYCGGERRSENRAAGTHCYELIVLPHTTAHKVCEVPDALLSMRPPSVDVKIVPLSPTVTNWLLPHVIPLSV